MTRTEVTLLRYLRGILVEERDTVLTSACPQDGKGNYIVEDMDAGLKPYYRKYQRGISRIDEALKQQRQRERAAANKGI